MKRLINTRKFRTVTNHNSIIPQIDNRLTDEPNRTVEYIFTKPAWKLIFSKQIFQFHSSINPYGHAGIRYYNPYNGKSIVMNVSNSPLINFFDSDKYLFTDDKMPGNGQCGVFNRSFLSIRIENVDLERIKKLHEFYLNLQHESLKPSIKYGMILYPLTNPIRRLFGFPIKGNCSYWTGLGLKEIGLVKNTSNWPLLLWFKLLFNQMEHNIDNINIISYPSINYKKEPTGSLLAPYIGLMHGYESYWNLDQFANIKVKIGDDNSYKLKEYSHVREIWLKTKEKMKDLIKFKQ